MLEEWSKQRSDTFTRLDDTIINNPNVKIYKTKTDSIYVYTNFSNLNYMVVLLQLIIF